jgi:hypothetical protein
MFVYQVSPVYANNIIADVTFKSLSSYNFQTAIISSIAISQDFIAIGCNECNTYKGKVDVYDKKTFTKIF